MVKENDPQRLAQRACEILVETQKYDAAWIFLNPQNGGTPVVAKAGDGTEQEILEAAFSAGSCPGCLDQPRGMRDGISLISPRLACADGYLADASPGAQVGVAPLRHGGRDFGTLWLSLPKGVFREDERELASEVAADLGLALWGIENERRRAAYAQIVANSPDAMTLVNRNLTYQEANRSYCDLLGHTEENIVGHRVSIGSTPSVSRTSSSHTWSAASRGKASRSTPR